CAYLIGRTYRDMGDLKAAKKAYDKLLKKHAGQYVAVLARVDLVDIAEKEKEDSRRVALLRELTYDVDRKGPAGGGCGEDGRKLARHCFGQGDFPEGIKALATTCSENDLPHHLMHPSIGNLFTFVQNLCTSKEEETKKKGERLADAAVVWYRGQATAVKDEK